MQLGDGHMLPPGLSQETLASGLDKAPTTDGPHIPRPSSWWPQLSVAPCDLRGEGSRRMGISSGGRQISTPAPTFLLSSQAPDPVPP